MKRLFHFIWCHILFGDHPVHIVHSPTRMYKCKTCGHTYRDQFLER